ncbi:MAG: ABC transporter substrate-binding protein [Pseudonocardiaceae bacterium]
MAGYKVLLAAALLVTAGCTGAAAPVPDNELVWAAGGITARGPAAEIAELWNQRHPEGPRVRLVELSDSTDDQRQLMALELNAGISEFDILDVDVIWTGEFAENGWLVDLEDLRPEIERVSLRTPLQTAIWDGTLWAAPYETDAGLLYYRTDLVDEPPETWHELRDVGLRVGREQGIAPFVADGAQYEGMVVQYLEYFWGAGGEMFDTDGTTVRFEQEPALEAARFMREAFEYGFYADGFDTMELEAALEQFKSGQAVFMRMWPYAYRQMTGPDADPDSRVVDKVGLAPLPTFGDEPTVTALGGHNLGVSRFSGNVPAAKEFVRWVSTSPQVQRLLAQQYSRAPTLASMYDELAGDPVLARLDQVLPNARPRPPTPEWTSISEEIQQQIFAAYHGNQEPEAAVDAIRNYLVATAAED